MIRVRASAICPARDKRHQCIPVAPVFLDPCNSPPQGFGERGTPATPFNAKYQGNRYSLRSHASLYREQLPNSTSQQHHVTALTQHSETKYAGFSPKNRLG